MIEVDSIFFENFMSYGPYRTTVPVRGLGPCLITGPNGAGKSTIINSMLYAVFGRTMHAARPGDRIINWRSPVSGCLAGVRLTNGDSIVRTRGMSGHNELVVERNGEPVLSTLSTSAHQQTQLNKLYGLDWYNFCNTSFLTQKGHAWFEMPEPQRKKELERALKLDRLTLRAQVAKTRVDAATREQKALLDKKASINNTIMRIAGDLGDARTMEGSFDDDRLQRHSKALAQHDAYMAKHNESPEPDIESIKSGWDAIARAQSAVQKYQDKVAEVDRQIAVLQSRATNTRKSIESWRAKAGRECASCQQEVPHEHTEEAIRPLVDELSAFECELGTLNTQRLACSDTIRKLQEAIVRTRPVTSVREAEMAAERRKELLVSARKWHAYAEQIMAESNPHTATVAKLVNRLSEAEEELPGLSEELNRLDAAIQHLSYIHKSYNDRKRIKSFGMSKYRPILNRKLRHYMDKFKLDMDIAITDSLSVSTSGADIDFISGGEQMRLNVSFMLARFDVHEEIFGRQCNIIVLDEVDGKMDEVGVECLADVVLNDLAPRVDAVLVISHKAAMRDLFPNQINVDKHNGFSVLGSLR